PYIRSPATNFHLHSGNTKRLLYLRYVFVTYCFKSQPTPTDKRRRVFNLRPGIWSICSTSIYELQIKQTVSIGQLVKTFATDIPVWNIIADKARGLQFIK